ncbi:SMI1/KNR4 family protein [Pseudonocardia spirodelae]|uniref:SMI1/KNR4 family protein n=1 Tax=Pseudonocardia spirodelae TaxID=3133431 RepID=A0ABU8T3W4_9PSEU
MSDPLPPAAGLPEVWTAWLRMLDGAGFPATANVRPPAPPEAVAAAEAVFGAPFPPALAALYGLADGQWNDHPRAPGPHPEVATSIFPATYRFLPLDEAVVQYRGWLDVVEDWDHGHVTVREGDPVRARYWDPGWWPLAVDGGGNALAVDTVPEPGGEPGQVVVAGPDEDERRRVATGVADYLRRLLAGPPPAPEDTGDGATDHRFWDAPHLR